MSSVKTLEPEDPLVATLEHLIRALYEQEPGLVEFIYEYVKVYFFCLINQQQEHIEYFDLCGIPTHSKTILKLWFADGFGTKSVFTAISFNVITKDEKGVCSGKRYIKEFSLEFREKEEEEEIIEDGSRDYEIYLYAPYATKAYFDYEEYKFNLRDILQVWVKDSLEPIILVEIFNEESYLHGLSDLELDIDIFHFGLELGDPFSLKLYSIMVDD